MLYWILAIIMLLVVAVFAYLQLPKFGSAAAGERLEAIKHAANYQNGEFTNEIATPLFTTDKSFLQILFENMGDKPQRLRPENPLPSVHTAIKQLDRNQDLFIWLGHSSFYLQIAGKTLLLDPVFSEDAAPVPYVNRPFGGTNIFNADDFPAIDALLISHDHWDHLDYPSVMALKPKVDQVITGLGIGASFDAWGFENSKIHSGNWNSQFDLGDGVKVNLVPARHYSGRSLSRKQTLWAGFIVESPKYRLYFSGDSGYGPHFKELQQRFGEFDFVALDSGQYDARWANIHMTPEQAVQAATELNTKAFFPEHIGKFALAKHPWDEPFQRAKVASEGKPFTLVTPLIGEAILLDGMLTHSYRDWWAEAAKLPQTANTPALGSSSN
ncbi:MBL fold metallo-hydrolase [Shewanella avicenniae]|uniref:MBL fold metallo-hydrolase n=1 Tax=Shewanella avicenniae TaxID=2814294 RepID=A0ABX7QLH4_9GAMM|nr:MBL fold metallo-hydrolase [Shewanella avicenniae]QSX32119.1 MBL fold metallo-hydrolase [Shewanella avicenniae]